jgi:hypothetical protein
MKKVFCRQSGFDCDYVIEGYTENDLFRNGQKHALNRHGMKNGEFISCFNERLRPMIKQYD